MIFPECHTSYINIYKIQKLQPTRQLRRICLYMHMYILAYIHTEALQKAIILIWKM